MFARVEAIGLSGQMHGAVLLDAQDRPVRPAILWNDGRALEEATELAALGKELQEMTGVRPMPGFTGPKIKWLRRHEPAALARTAHLLLPKDFIGLQLTGERVTDMSDAAGTWLLDEAARAWSPAALQACGVDPAWLPCLLEADAIAGQLRPELAQRWGMPAGILVAAGGGDTAVGGVGIGAISDGQGFVSLGTSAQVFVAATTHAPAPDRLVHAFCHALPGRWYRMAAMLNGASPLAAVSRWTGHTDIGRLLAEVEAAYKGPSALLALPYLSGERTPHNDPHARGVFVGLSGSTEPLDLVQAMLEAVAYSLADGFDALTAAGSRIDHLGFIGGGARSRFWGELIASVLGVSLVRFDAADRGPAFGAARLARLCQTGEDPVAVAVAPPIDTVIDPDPRLQEAYRPRLEAFRTLYQTLRPVFPTLEAGPSTPR